MALSDGNLSAADVAAVTGNNGWGGFGGDGAWLMVLFLFAMMGGGMGWGGFGGWGGGMFGMDMLATLPYFYNTQTQNDVNRGFDNVGLSNQLSGIQASINNAEVANCNREINSLQTAYNNQIASMNQSFANAQALDSRLDTMTLNQQNCCCENRLATVQTQNIVQNEAANTRAAGTADTQKILDKLCQLELDGKNDKILDLQNQLNIANLAASQTAQTARILADNAAQTVALEQYLNPVPIPAYPVCGYGRGFGFNYGNGMVG